MGIDLHTHSAVSDGQDSPAELVAKAATAGLDAIALTDHDTFDGLEAAAEAAGRTSLRLLRGVEISTQLEGRSIHLLGYGPRATDADLADELARIRRGRSGRIPAMCQQLSSAGLEITPDDVLRAADGSPSPGRPHVADVLVAKGYVADRKEAFDRWLDDGKPGYVHRYAVPLTRGIELVRRAGGVAVLAHPWGRGSRAVLGPERLAELAADHGLDGLEVDHTDHDPRTRTELRALASSLGLLATGSSDYHGIGKPRNPLGVNTTPPEVFEELLNRIVAREGAPW